MTMYPDPPCKECEEYVNILKDQLEEKSRLVNLMADIIKDKDDKLLSYQNLLREVGVLEDK